MVKQALYARLSGPEIAKVEGDRIERTNAHRLVVLRARDQQPLPVVELERLESAIDRVDEPQVWDRLREGVDWARCSFRSSSRVDVRHRLAHPVRRERDLIPCLLDTPAAAHGASLRRLGTRMSSPRCSSGSCDDPPSTWTDELVDRESRSRARAADAGRG